MPTTIDSTHNDLRTQDDLERARRALDREIILYSRRIKRCVNSGIVSGVIITIWCSAILFNPQRWAPSDFASFVLTAVFFAFALSGIAFILFDDRLGRLQTHRHDLDAASNLEIAKLAGFLDVPEIKSRMQHLAASGREITHADCRDLLREGSSGYALRDAKDRLDKVCRETGLRCADHGAQQQRI